MSFLTRIISIARIILLPIVGSLRSDYSNYVKWAVAGGLGLIPKSTPEPYRHTIFFRHGRDGSPALVAPEV